MASAAVAVFGAGAARASEITSTWSGSTGNWTDPTQWWTNPNYPNNGTPSGTTYDAVINAPGTGAYTVTLNSNITTDSVTLDSANATLSQTGGTLTTTTLNIAAGGYGLDGGVLQSATLTSSNTSTVNIQGSTIVNSTIDLASTSEFGGDTLINVTLASDLTTTDTTFVNGIDGSGYTLNVVGHDGDTYSSDLLVEGTANSSTTLSNININLGGNPANIFHGGFLYSIDTGVGLTIESTTIVQGWGAIGARDTFNDFPLDPAVANQGTITANISGQTLQVRSTALINTGTLQAIDGGILSITPGGSTTWTNNGILAVDGISMITVNQNLKFDSGSLFDAMLGSNGISGLLSISGGLNILGGVDLNLNLAPGAVFSTPYEIVSYTGTLTGTFTDITPGFVVDYSQPGEIVVTVVPEPGAWGLVIGGGLLALGRRRRAVQAG